MPGDVVASQVEIITAEILVLKNQTAANIIEIGKRLVKVKEMLPHGEWGKWLQDRVEFSHQTADKFMRVAREFENYAPVRNLGVSKVFALLEVPADQRDELVSRPQVIPSTGEVKTIGEMTKRELEQVKRAMKDAEQARSALETAQAKLSEVEERSREAEAARRQLQEELERLKENPATELEGKIAELERALELARKAAADREAEAEKLRNALLSLEKRLKELENAPPKVVEKIPDDYSRLKEDLEKKNSELLALTRSQILQKDRYKIHDMLSSLVQSVGKHMKQVELEVAGHCSDAEVCGDVMECAGLLEKAAAEMRKWVKPRGGIVIEADFAARST